MINNEKLPVLHKKIQQFSSNNSRQIRTLLSEELSNNRAQSFDISKIRKDPLLQSNSYWVEKSIRLPNFMHSSSVNYNIINHSSNHSSYIKNLTKAEKISHRKKGISEFCDYDKISKPSINKAYQVNL